MNKELTLHNIDRRKTKAASLFAFPKITMRILRIPYFML
ncbi:Uncharacterised protein [Vibrio cholerae]|nr:Uncharacterised protein [Vibrio cholerae]